MSACVNARKVYVRRAGHKGISPLPEALVEGRRRAQWYSPGTTDSLRARKAKAAHQINPVVAQSKIGRRAVDGFYARDFNLRQGRCRGVGRPQRLRLLRISGKRPGDCRTAEKRDEIAPPHHSITSSARASSVGGTARPSALVVLR